MNFSIVFKKVILFLLSFIGIHTVFWISSIIFYNWCVPSGFVGYFKSMINHGSIVCEVFYNISLFAKTSIRNMIVSLLAGVMTLTWSWDSFNKEVKHSTNKNNEVST